MSIVRVGSNQKYSDGWESAFGKGRKSARKTTAAKAQKASKKAAKPSGKRSPAKAKRK